MFLKKYTFAILSLLLTGFGLQAQTFFTEDFAGSFPADWTSTVVSGNGTPSAAWQYTTTGPSGPFATADLASTTATNGWMIFDSDANCAYADQDAWLISPAFDASDKTAVWLIFETFYRSFLDRPQIRVGTDLNNLSSWATYEVFPGIEPSQFGGVTVGDPSLNPQSVQFDISADAVGQATVYFAFQFLSDATTSTNPNLTGCAYNWQIDDVILTETDPRPANEMRINSFAAVAPNVATPISQIEPIGFIADIANFGSATQPNTVLNMTITNGAGTVVFTDQLNYGTITPDSTAENVFFPNEFTPPAVADVYTATYSLDYPGIADDAIPGNNELSFVFAVTDSLFAKEGGATRGVSPAADESYTYGNVFYVNNAQNATGEDLFARYISFGVNNADELVGRFATILLLEWGGDTNENFAADQDEYTIAGFNSYEFTGEEGNTLISVSTNEDEFYPLTANTYYIAAVQYSTDDTQDFQLLASEEYDFAAMNFYTDSLNRIRYAGALDVSNEGSLGMTGFGLDIVPVVRLSIGPDVIINTTEVVLPENAVVAFPNPADALVNLDFNLAEKTSGTMVVFNTKGQIVSNRKLADVQNDRLQLDTTELPNGLYLVRIDTELGVRNLKITVQH
ncbi:MAG: hypothetical protein DA408_15480 [Bacteroidetes bacterium]|nr:MAG: hypothetical protein C7N36_18405 [Bacteroidota bacterium]PTM10649.1 MAG: hypothetical protein DA408_15480 [Bacteroidota bacterium]